MLRSILLSILSLFLLIPGIYAEEAMPACRTGRDEVIYLKNGSIIHGMIIEIIPNETMKIATRDGSLFVFRMEEIEKITREPRIDKSETPIVKGDRKTPAVALVLSLVAGGLLPLQGTGQWYNGETGKGFAYFGIGAVSAGFLFIGLDSDDDNLASIGAITYLFSWIAGCVDAFDSAKRINRERGYSLQGENPKLILTLHGDKREKISLGIQAEF